MTLRPQTITTAARRANLVRRDHRARIAAGACLIAACALFVPASRTLAAEAEWIWSPAYEKELAEPGDCYFRKSFSLSTPENGVVQIAADDAYELYVNGRLVGSGKNWKTLDTYDITKYLMSGSNTIAVKATNGEKGSAGLVARVAVQSQGGTHVSHSTDATWKTSLKEFSQWTKPRFQENQWLAARSFGRLNATLPWGNEVTDANATGRFRVQPDFRVEWVIEPKETGSLIAMTFDEFGQIIAGRENGPLILIRDDNRDGLLDTVTTLCDQVRNCQGILAVSGRVFVIGEGPQGVALYRLSDEDQDGRIDAVEPVVRFTGEPGEHGPHALALGPDGLIYMVLGNFARPDRPFEPSSPHHHFYEGDLIQPRYEDASGHAVGIKAPGGTIVRTDAKGSAIELYAGGLQNPYDLAFNRDGELFTADSDMEWDLGMPWYRPTRVNHVVPGAEFGWRSGWAKWPDYFYDSLPAAAETGRGSPTGIEVYNHVMFPQRFHNAVFVCDWSRGRIVAVRSKPVGGSYEAVAEPFLEGQPLNVTDCAVGPDGALYFCTGGRGTEGGVYRAVWDGKTPPEATDLGKGISAALKQPQLQSAWARQQVALVKQQLGKQWGPELNAIAERASAPTPQRLRALDLLQLFGPAPSNELLVRLASDPAPAVRGRAAQIMGVSLNEVTQAALVEMLWDSDPRNQRLACEALARSGAEAPPDKLLRLLASEDRHVAWAARRLLEQLPVDGWRKLVLRSPDKRVFLQGALALATLEDADSARDILARVEKLLAGYLTDTEFVNLLRLTQVTFLRGKVDPEQFDSLREALANEYPSKNHAMNRELTRLLTYLQAPKAAEQFVDQLRSDIPSVDKMQIAMHARFLKTGWTPARKLELLRFYEDARAQAGGHSFAGYIENVSRDFFAEFTDEDRKPVLAGGAKWPGSALSMLAKLPEHPSEETLRQVIALDRDVKRVDSDSARKLRIGIVAVLGASKDPEAMAYLRELFEAEPERRVVIAMGLAQDPQGKNWPLLVRSLSIVEGSAAQEVIAKLALVDEAPSEPEPYRQAILRGLMLRDNGGQNAVALLEKWTGQRLGQPGQAPLATLAEWQTWFNEKYPDQPEARLPQETEQNHWTQQELLSFLTGPQGAGDRVRGAAVFERARCVACHRSGNRGESVGPDLTTLGARFQKKEILESILFPSQVISDQYASRVVVTRDGRTLTGMAAPTGDGALTMLLPDGKKVTLRDDEIESSERARVSSMPEGLINGLSLEEVADLFAYLTRAPQEEREPQARRPLRAR